MERPSQRFPLLVYQRVVRRFRRVSMLLAALLLGLWYPVHADALAWPRPPADGWLLAGGAVALAFVLLAWIGGKLAYAQARRDLLRVQTPVFRMNISYRRIASIGPVDMDALFAEDGVSRGLRGLAAPFFGRTALKVELSGYPMPRWFLRLFLHPLFFSPGAPSLALLVDAWEGLSLQLTARIDAWRGAKSVSGAWPGGERAPVDSAPTTAADTRLDSLLEKLEDLEELLVLHSWAPASGQKALAQRVHWLRKMQERLDARPKGIELELALSTIRRTLQKRRGSFSNYRLSPARHGLLSEREINARFRRLIAEILDLCTGTSRS